MRGNGDGQGEQVMRCTQEMCSGFTSCGRGGALWLVVHDAAIGVQGERETAAKPLHGLVQGREPKHDRDDAHSHDADQTANDDGSAAAWTVAAAKIRGNIRGTVTQPPRVVCWLVCARGT